MAKKGRTPKKEEEKEVKEEKRVKKEENLVKSVVKHIDSFGEIREVDEIYSEEDKEIVKQLVGKGIVVEIK